MTRKIAFGAAFLWLLTVALAGFFFIRGHTMAGSDGRTSVIMQSGERDFVLGEMRSLLAATGEMVKGLAQGNNAAIAKAARSVGKAAMHDAPASLMVKLPLDFKRSAIALHGGFDEVADAAEKGESTQALAGLLATQMDRCAACHKAYRFDTAQ